jgi:hypothetical protein
LFALIFLLTATVGFAQSTSARLFGTVTDPTNAAIPGVKITVTSVETGAVQSTESSSSGFYVISPLAPGHYSIVAESQGFRRLEQTGLMLTVSQQATLNLTLQLGNVQDTIQVSATPELINASSADLSSIVDSQAIAELPLNGRDPSSLVLLAPGMTNALRLGSVLQSTNSFPTETGASSGGGRSGSTYFLLDGVPNMDTYNLLSAPFPNSDATQEFRVTTNNFDARYGFASGALVSIQTKSGANDFHGGAFEFIRNNDLNAGNWFNKSVNTLKRHQYGVFAGGPIVRNKIFFFANYQGTHAVTAANSSSLYAPTTAMLNGDFSAVPKTLANGFTSNKINPSLFSPAALALVKDLPTGSDPATGLIYYAGPVARTIYNEGTGRIDYALGNAQHISLRSFIDHIGQPANPLRGNIASATIGEQGYYFNEAINHIWTISPRLVNSLSAAWIRMDYSSGAQQLDASGNPVCLSQITKISDPANGCYLTGLSVTNGFTTPYDENNTEKRATLAFSDAATYTRGNHLLTFGADIFHQYAREYSLYPANAIVGFSGYSTGFGLADFLLGRVSSLLQGAGETQQLAGYQVGLYIQDQYKLRPNLTLTAGLRWEPNLAPKMKDGRGAAFVAGQQSTRYPNAPLGLVFPGDAGVSDSLMPVTYKYFNPRVGFAWQPRKNTSIHGAFGMFTAPVSYINYNHTADVAPFSPTYTLSGSASNPISFDDPWASYSTGTSPFPPFTYGTVPSSSATFITPLSVGTSFSRNFRLAVTQSWNISVDQQLSSDIAIHLAYVGSETYHQLTPVDRNPGIFASSGARTTYPKFAQILEYNTAGTASYNSLQAGVEKRMKYGLQFQSNLTWAKTFDVATLGTNVLSSVPNPFNIRFNRGISDQNVPITWATNMVYSTPALAGHRSLRRVFGNWQVSGVWQYGSGKPFSISGGNGNNRSLAQVGRDRADLTGKSFNVHSGNRANWLVHYYDTAAFQTNTAGTFGNSQRNIFHGPPFDSIDMGIGKKWAIFQKYTLQFRWEAFNALNHPSFSTPNTDPTSSSGGKITSTSNDPRVMQGALKLTF